jgi:mercuric reductase
VDANEVRVEIYRSFVEDHRAPTSSEVGERLGMSTEEAEAALRELHDQDVIALHPSGGGIWLAHPFCATPAPFSVTSGAESWEGICIWDALGILALLERDGSVTTACPDCDMELRVSVEDGRVHGSEDLVVHYGVPASSWYEDVGYT